jgi:hypothetical protein
VACKGGGPDHRGAIHLDPDETERRGSRIDRVSTGSSHERTGETEEHWAQNLSTGGLERISGKQATSAGAEGEIFAETVAIMAWIKAWKAAGVRELGEILGLRGGWKASAWAFYGLAWAFCAFAGKEFALMDNQCYFVRTA